MKITFLTVGKNNDDQIEKVIGRYMNRLAHYAKVEAKSLNDVKVRGAISPDVQKKMEGASILAAVRPGDHVVLLDEGGKEYTSRQFSELLSRHLVGGTRELVFVVGGPFGFSSEVYERADALLSLSKMTLTHEMVRLFFVEQLYRAFTIIRGENYHHD